MLPNRKRLILRCKELFLALPLIMSKCFYDFLQSKGKCRYICSRRGKTRIALVAKIFSEMDRKYGQRYAYTVIVREFNPALLFNKWN